MDFMMITFLFELAPHHRGIATLNAEIYAIKDDKRIGLLRVVEKMNQWRPRALRFDRSKNRLMGRSCFARPDSGILDQDIVLAGDLFELIEKGRCFGCVF